MLCKLSSLALMALLLSSAAPVAAQMNTKKSSGVFSLGVAGVATPQPNILSVAAPLVNLTNRVVAEIKIDRIQLATAPVQTPLPMTVGAVRARSSVSVRFHRRTPPIGCNRAAYIFARARAFAIPPTAGTSAA